MWTEEAADKYAREWVAAHLNNILYVAEERYRILLADYFGDAEGGPLDEVDVDTLRVALRRLAMRL